MNRNAILGWVRNERGNIALLFALMIPLVVGGAAFGVETTYWYLNRLQLQTAADAAAMAGAMDARSGYTTTITSTATKAAGDNGYSSSGGTITVNYPPTSGSSGPKAVEVILTGTSTRFFSQVFTSTPVSIRARAVAKYTEAGSACVLALSPNASNAAQFWGSAHLSLTGCSVMSNSVSSSAVAVGGSGYLAADCLFATGGVSVDSGAHMTCAQNVTGTAPVADPYKDVPIPANGTSQNDNKDTLDPGYYSGGISVAPSKSKTLNPGVYVVDSTFDIKGDISCNGCVIYFKSTLTKFNINSSSVMDMKAPTTGDYAGMLFFGDRNLTTAVTINGNSTSHLTGSIYFKKAAVSYLGNYSGLNGCTYVIGDTVSWSGNSTFNVDCTAYGMLPIPAAYSVKLSE